MKQLYPSSQKRNLLAPALGAFALGAALLAAPAAHAQTRIEAEAATNTLTGGAVVAMTLATASNGSYVDFNGAPSGLTIPYTAATAGAYDLIIRYESQYDFKYGTLSINNTAATAPSIQLYFKSTKTGSTFLSTSKIRVNLVAGANTITIAGGYNYYGIDYISLQAAPATVTPLALSAAGRVEAELGTLYLAQAVTRDGEAATVSGTTAATTGYVTNLAVAVNSTITLPITVATTGLYQIAVGARAQFALKSFDLSVNARGKLTTAVPTADPGFASFVVGKYNLTAGTNTITISNADYVDFDYMDVTPTTGTATAARASADAQKALTVYPNPTDGQSLNVSLDLATAQNATIELVNTLGQRVLSTSRNLKAGGNQFQVATDHVAAGVYQLVVRNGDQPTLSRRVLVSK
ncbi:CBM35 domain-containing protein [Hymenobacter caeli]|uniref:CBM6 domain-containing protein n=1 Tax=Hymenobacter caeli TaxID=2735894 RepID=A0ABX2FST6_9BACT|nr:CBM35 domain-containing protein [Hymenobacter caeli]NRT19445.1 hypothetical protein [Hymenobacter caeli]